MRYANIFLATQSKSSHKNYTQHITSNRKHTYEKSTALPKFALYTYAYAYTNKWQEEQNPISSNNNKHSSTTEIQSKLDEKVRTNKYAKHTGIHLTFLVLGLSGVCLLKIFFGIHEVSNNVCVAVLLHTRSSLSLIALSRQFYRFFVYIWSLFVFVARIRFVCTLWTHWSLYTRKKNLSQYFSRLICCVVFLFHIPCLWQREHGNNPDRLLIFIFETHSIYQAAIAAATLP